MTSRIDPSRRLLLQRLGAAAIACGAVRSWADVAPPPEVTAELPGARLRGNGLMTFLGLKIYDARLWVQEGFRPDSWWQSPLALELDYHRSLVGKLIAERSLTEMRRVDTVDDARGQQWLARMTAIFPDVKEGDRIVGVQHPGQPVRFYMNGQQRGEVSDLAFARPFFGIWLSPRTSEPGLRSALIGEGR